MTKWLPCRLCGSPIQIPAKYAMVKTVAHPECEAAAKAGVDFNAEPDYGDDFDDLWAEFVADYEANKDEIKKGKEAARARMRARAQEVEAHEAALAAMHEEVVKFREAMAMVEAEKKLDEPIVPGGTVTRRDLTRYAKETEDFPAYVAKHATDARPWWAKLFNL